MLGLGALPFDVLYDWPSINMPHRAHPPGIAFLHGPTTPVQFQAGMLLLQLLNAASLHSALIRGQELELVHLRFRSSPVEASFARIQRFKTPLFETDPGPTPAPIGPRATALTATAPSRTRFISLCVPTVYPQHFGFVLYATNFD